MDTLYIRVRGRVLGPYDQEKLQSLARRGQLSRMHELSADGASWVRAANYPELFTGAQAEMPAPREVAQAPVAAATDGASNAASQSRTQQQWYYSSGGVQRGPVDFSNLQLLVGTSQVRAEDSVWTEGMAAWMPASQIPGLTKTATSAIGESTGDKDALSDMLCRSFTGSRPWIMFIVVAIFIYAGLEAAGGLYFLVAGGRAHSTRTVEIGIFALLWALDAIIGAFLLGSYHSKLGSLTYREGRTNQILERAHQRLLAAWIYAAINLLIMLVLLGVAFVYAFSSGLAISVN